MFHAFGGCGGIGRIRAGQPGIVRDGPPDTGSVTPGNLVERAAFSAAAHI
jgi:hypothetical protein